MSIVYDEKYKLFTLRTENTLYQAQISETGHLLHLYYGSSVDDRCDYLYPLQDRGFSPNPYELREGRNWSLDQLPQEISTVNGGDYRISALDICSENGIIGSELTYLSHEIKEGKYPLENLPFARGDKDSASSLEITLSDKLTGIEVDLIYAVYEAEDVITRALRVRNNSDSEFEIEQIASVCLDVPYGITDMIHFHGRHAMEMQKERITLPFGIATFSSSRGMTSHQHNPFVILLEKETNEDFGNCYGVMLSYSGSHSFSVEKDQSASVRLIAGINEDHFVWYLKSGDSFETPESILSFSADGVTKLSHNYHKFIRKYVIERPEGEALKPVLLNSWEALYCDFDDERILRLAEKSKELGADLFVMDDGWFGNRIDDKRSLGDWYENPERFPRGLKDTAEKITEMGLRFGIWIEPEMISEDSELIKEHPEWVLRIPGRKPTMGREQMVLDLSRSDVVDYLYEVIGGLLGKIPATYVKWDMNRGLSDLYSEKLEARKMRELPHRYLLGLYALLSKLKKEFPEVLFEGCAGGGGRFDAGMMSYFPQIWASDNTDPIARLSIQQGASYGYPVCVQGAHVSASPNHQTGRSTSLGVRSMVAMSGSFGYELDPGKLSDEERAEIRNQIQRFRDYEHILHDGYYYRLSDEREIKEYSAWQHVSEDGRETIVNLVITNPQANANAIHIRLKGLNPGSYYRILKEDKYGTTKTAASVWLNAEDREGLTLSSETLMRAGLAIAPMQGDYPGVQYYLKEVQ